jgi:hypothetical protein
LDEDKWSKNGSYENFSPTGNEEIYGLIMQLGEQTKPFSCPYPNDKQNLLAGLTGYLNTSSNRPPFILNPRAIKLAPLFPNLEHRILHMSTSILILKLYLSHSCTLSLPLSLCVSRRIIGLQKGI